MIKRKDGLWLICYEKSGVYVEGSGYFKTLTEAQVAEETVLAAHPEPVQHLKGLSDEGGKTKSSTSKVYGKKHS
jgi:hypothetical protein